MDYILKVWMHKQIFKEFNLPLNLLKFYKAQLID